MKGFIRGAQWGRGKVGTPAQAVGLEAGAPGPRSQVAGREAGTSVMATWLRLLESMGALGLGGVWLNLLDPVHPSPAPLMTRAWGKAEAASKVARRSCPAPSRLVASMLRRGQFSGYSRFPTNNVAAASPDETWASPGSPGSCCDIQLSVGICSFCPRKLPSAKMKGLFLGKADRQSQLVVPPGVTAEGHLGDCEGG